MTPQLIVENFLAAWAKSPEALIQSYRDTFTDTTVWENVGMATTTGIDEALALLSQFETGLGLVTMHVETLSIATSGNRVLTERVDTGFDSHGNQVMSVRLMGVFEIADGKITSWRDYFDPSPFKG